MSVTAPHLPLWLVARVGWGRLDDDVVGDTAGDWELGSALELTLKLALALTLELELKLKLEFACPGMLEVDEDIVDVGTMDVDSVDTGTAKLDEKEEE
jgi:hypothetical protein